MRPSLRSGTGDLENPISMNVKNVGVRPALLLPTVTVLLLSLVGIGSVLCDGVYVS